MSVIFARAVVTMQPGAVFSQDHMLIAVNSAVLNEDGDADLAARDACGAKATGRTLSLLRGRGSL
jgi:hypothetical protein